MEPGVVDHGGDHWESVRHENPHVRVAVREGPEQLVREALSYKRELST